MFDGKLNPNMFLVWLANLKDYFDWNGKINAQCVCFAKMRLVRFAKYY